MIKTWQERCEEHPDHEGIVTEQMIRDRMQEEIDALRQAIEQAEKQEPVAWSVFDKRTGKHWYTNDSKNIASGYAEHYGHREPDGRSSTVVMPLYAAPVHASDISQERVDKTVKDRHEWVGLTDEAVWLEYQQLWPFHPAEEPTLAKDIAKFARAIEAKLKEKNT